MNESVQEHITKDAMWLKLSFVCPMALTEAAGDLLAVQSRSGVEERPEQNGVCVLSGFFALSAGDESAQEAESAALTQKITAELTELFALYGEPAPMVCAGRFAGEDWATSWRQYFKPFQVAPGLILKPSWERYDKEPGEQVLEIDPGMAFGTGGHASTHDALALIHLALQGQRAASVLDVGTGTGILAMAAVLWGAASALALDKDPEAVRVATENVAANGLAEKVRVAALPLAEVQGSFSLVCANIVHDTLVEMAPVISRLTRPGGKLVLAGLLSGLQEKNLLCVYQSLGFTHLKSLYQDEWAALLLQRQEHGL